MMQPTVIKGSPGGPGGKWAEVQAVMASGADFVYIHHNGSHWAGEEPDDVTKLLEVLAEYQLQPDYSECSVDPCRWQHNPRFVRFETTTEPQYIDGPRMYRVDGVWRFSGNFAELSHAFCIDTNHRPTIEALRAAFTANKARDWSKPCVS